MRSLASFNSGLMSPPAPAACPAASSEAAAASAVSAIFTNVPSMGSLRVLSCPSRSFPAPPRSHPSNGSSVASSPRGRSRNTAPLNTSTLMVNKPAGPGPSGCGPQCPEAMSAPAWSSMPSNRFNAEALTVEVNTSLAAMPNLLACLAGSLKKKVNTTRATALTANSTPTPSMMSQADCALGCVLSLANGARSMSTSIATAATIMPIAWAASSTALLARLVRSNQAGTLRR